MKLIISIIAIVTFGLGVILLGAGPGTKAGLWDFGTAFSMFKMLAMPALIGAVLSVIGGIAAIATGRGSLGFFALFAAALAAGGGYIPIKMRALAMANPYIHDVTTDFENPPQIVTGAREPRKNPPEYVGAETILETDQTVAQAQFEAFPDLKSLYLATTIDAATEKAKATLKSMKMETIGEGAATIGEGAWRIEAVYTSQWVGFKDDFVVRLQSVEGDQIRVDVRSKSRMGGSDLGANAVRTKEFLERMKS